MMGVFYFCSMVDYLIVGSGLAGVCFAEFALQSGKTILVFENDSQPSSMVAGGLYNPVVLKRFSEIWKAQEQLDIASVFYPRLEQKLGVTFDFPMPILRKFASVEEQNNWFVAADKPKLSAFLNPKVLHYDYDYCPAPYGFGEVLHSGYLDIQKMVLSYREYLKEREFLVNDSFAYDSLEINNEFVSYKEHKAKHIVFAEGFGLHQNSYFNDLPLDGTKGELLHIKAPELQLKEIIKSGVFILPVGNEIYKVGATYNWSDKTNLPTKEGKEELLEKLNELITCEYEVVEHLAGVRPTVKDRRPLVGTHYQYNNVHLLNGLGTRGVMLGPFLAQSLLRHIEEGLPLDKEINIERYYKKRAKS
ncbi:FAD-dependent oxidoreductase [Flavobacterium sp. NRK F10]|uniref:NAD(P)/FAD-dependent oxidoreductase n=1 Tax=Flavobacterium sp. NRK F10 TaxID=2954931 RepID=UPI0027E21CB2|nr:FAD-dependent oxidoreductase [Flavobacterium sp. NRK F10]